MNSAIRSDVRKDLISVVSSGWARAWSGNSADHGGAPEQTGTAETTLVARTALPPQQAAELLRKTILDPELTRYSVGGLKDQLALPLFPARAAAIILGIFGFLAMVLAARKTALSRPAQVIARWL